MIESPELSVIDQISEKIDILDPLKFFEHVKILDATTNQIIKYEMWPHLQDFIGAICKHDQIIVLKAKQVGVCLDPETRILTADLEWKYLDEINVGDKLVSVDEYPQDGKGQRRHLRVAEVLDRNEVFEPAYMIKTDRGAVIATAEHRFLVDGDGKQMRKDWYSIKKAPHGMSNLSVGKKIRMLVDPWGDSTYEDGWFGGMLDGEGCLNYKRMGVDLEIAQLPSETMERCKRYLERRGIKYTNYFAKHTETQFGRDVERVGVNRIDNIMKIMGRCRPTRFPPEWWAGKALGNSGSGEIVGIELLGQRRMIDLMTSTGTFIANGFISHNSWTLAAMAVWWCYKVGGNVIMISKGEAEAAELLRKAKFIYSQLPKHLQLKTGHDSVFSIDFEKKHSRIHTLPSTEYAGVGETASLVIWDENEFHPNAKENWGHLKPTIDAGANGVVVSTADPTSIDSHFKTLWREARAGRNNFYPIFIPRDAVPSRNDEWFERVKRDYYLEWQFKADYPQTEEEALSPITGRAVFDVAILQRLQKEALKEEEIRQGVIHIFHRPRTGVQYIAGVDMAEGRGGDFSVLWIEAKDGQRREQVAIIHSNHILPDTFSFMSYELLKEYYSPKVVGGADAFGQTFFDYLLAHGYDRNKIYASDKKREKLGYVESGKTREKDILELERTIREGLKIHYKPALEELFAFQWKETKDKSRAEAAEGAHDDCVMACCKANFGFSQYKSGTDRISVTYSPTWRG